MEAEVVEERFRRVEDTVLLMHGDLKNIDKNTKEMSKALTVLAEIHTQQRVLEERTELRHTETKASIKHIHERIDGIKADQKKGVWIILTMFLFGIGKLVMDGMK